MKASIKRASAVREHTTAPATLSLASLLTRARAMTAEMSAKPAATAPSNTQARVAAPRTTASTGTIRRLSARTGSK